MLSFAIFPKPMTAMHVIGGIVTIVSLLLLGRNDVRLKAKSSPRGSNRASDDFEFPAWKGSQQGSSPSGMGLDEQDAAEKQSSLTVKWSAA